MSVDIKKAYSGAAMAKPGQEPSFYLSTTALTQPLQPRGYYRPVASLALFTKILSEMVAAYGLNEMYTSCESNILQDGSIRLKLSLRTDLLGRMTDKAHKAASRVFSDIALEDDSGRLTVNPYEMWLVAPNKIALMKGLISVIDQSGNMLLPPDRIMADTQYDLEPESEWLSPKQIGFSANDHQSIRNMQDMEYVALRSNQYRDKHSKAYFKDDLFLGLEARPYISLAHSYAGMTMGRIATISVSMQHLFKTISQEDGSAYAPGSDVENIPGGYN